MSQPGRGGPKPWAPLQPPTSMEPWAQQGRMPPDGGGLESPPPVLTPVPTPAPPHRPGSRVWSVLPLSGPPSCPKVLDQTGPAHLLEYTASPGRANIRPRRRARCCPFDGRRPRSLGGLLPHTPSAWAAPGEGGTCECRGSCWSWRCYLRAGWRRGLPRGSPSGRANILTAPRADTFVLNYVCKKKKNVGAVTC